MASEAGRQRVRGVFDQGDIPDARQRLECIAFGGVPGEVDRQQGSCPRRHRRRDQLRVDVERIRFDIDQHRACADVLDHIHGSREGHCRSDHFMSGSHAEAGQRRVHRRRARVERQRAGRTHKGGELLFKPSRLRTRRDPRRA